MEGVTRNYEDYCKELWRRLTLGGFAAANDSDEPASRLGKPLRRLRGGCFQCGVFRELSGTILDIFWTSEGY